MMTFAQAWERQERLRHQLLLQQLKAEFSTQPIQENAKQSGVRTAPVSLQPQPSDLPSAIPARRIPQPRLRKAHSG